MKIVVLDADPALGSSVAPAEARGELTFCGLETIGTVEIHQRTPKDQIIHRLRGAEVALTNKVPLSADTLRQLPDLKMISVLATGYNVVDVEAARAQGITVCNVPGYSTASTAQHTFALLLELCHRVGAHSDDVHAGGWGNSPAFSYWKHPLRELEGMTMGVVGFGAIGQRVAEIAEAFGMDVVVHTRTPKPEEFVRFVNKDDLLEESDVVTLHCPLTPDTEHFIDDDALSKMKRSAFLINVSRGPIVHEGALIRALDQKLIAGAAVDVAVQEPPPPGHPLCESPRCIVTPHIAWATEEARKRLLHVTQENVQSFARGEPQNVVS